MSVFDKSKCRNLSMFGCGCMSMMFDLMTRDLVSNLVVYIDLFSMITLLIGKTPGKKKRKTLILP